MERSGAPNRKSTGARQEHRAVRCSPHMAIARYDLGGLCRSRISWTLIIGNRIRPMPQAAEAISQHSGANIVREKFMFPNGYFRAGPPVQYVRITHLTPSAV